MNRRDFLFFRTEGEKKVAELSCEKLYMHFVDTNAASKFGQNESGIADDAEWWSGEPSVVVNLPDQNMFYKSLAEDVSEADVLVVSDRQWITEGEFSDLINDLLRHFSNAGGRVTYAE